ncbi:unnamed protein product [Symbiodinium necroappetens]|uniref:Uncharacterized protein n=1 Tax=Symbiodinium necroappetens TaxID=1628268 RepID=A0A813BG42_9DINO|nr:unnamed protein product [Symbiodinium necroappetens]
MAGPPVYRPGGTACAALVGAQNPFEPAARVPAAFEPVSRVPAVLPSKIVRTISPAQQWQPAAFACPGCGNVPLSDSIFCRRCGYRLKEDRPESPKAKTEDVVKLQSLVDSLQQANVELKLQAEMTPSLASQVEDLTKDLAACRQGKKRADEDLAKALRRVAELEAVVARQEADNSEGVLEKELLEDDRAKILEEANGRLFEMSRREQSLRVDGQLFAAGQCQLLKACCFRLWWCLRTDLPGLEVVSPPAPQEGTQAWCGQGVDPLPVNRMPLPDDWRGILQFQAQLFHGFAEALSHRTEVATGSSPKARAASPVHSREVAMSPKSPKEEGPAESAARHQHNGSAGHQHTEVLADFRAHPVNRPVEARKAAIADFWKAVGLGLDFHGSSITLVKVQTTFHSHRDVASIGGFRLQGCVPAPQTPRQDIEEDPRAKFPRPAMEGEPPHRNRSAGSTEGQNLLPESSAPLAETAAVAAQRHHWEFRATTLFLVVCCLEISDLIFAVDSVSAIVAQVNDLFLAYTSAVFAMLGLRATFFIIDVLVHMFELLKYGVAAVLIFIGVKLILAHHYTIEPHTVVLVLIGCIGASMVASVMKAEMEKKMQGHDPEDVAKRVEQVKEKTSPFTSPYAPAALPTQRAC